MRSLLSFLSFLWGELVPCFSLSSLYFLFFVLYKFIYLFIIQVYVFFFFFIISSPPSQIYLMLELLP